MYRVHRTAAVEIQVPTGKILWYEDFSSNRLAGRQKILYDGIKFIVWEENGLIYMYFDDIMYTLVVLLGKWLYVFSVGKCLYKCYLYSLQTFTYTEYTYMGWIRIWISEWIENVLCRLIYTFLQLFLFFVWSDCR